MLETGDPTIIAEGGDLVLQVSQEEGGPQFAYRVDSKVLQHHSRYFANLLSDRFSEGQTLTAALGALKLAGHPSAADAPIESLPVVAITHVGRISKVATIQNLTADFLRALHNRDIQPLPPLTNLANLVVVADRFDAIPHLARFAQRKRYMQTIDARPAKSKSRPGIHATEEKARQKLLVGLYLDYPLWITKYSKHLILRDSVQWKPDSELSDTAALWWDIPNGIEDELIQRREYILETINSIQAHFLKLYTSGERQCKLGYDSSLQCDSYQLGEMIRFLSKIGTLRLQGLIYDASEPTQYFGDIESLVESLRHVSSYQIDRNHAHCGLRVRLIPVLDLIHSLLSLDAGSLDVGICPHCWSEKRTLYAWSIAKRPLLWTQSRALTRGIKVSSSQKAHQRTPSSCLNRHVLVRDMFMAVDRDWTARDVS